MPKGFKKITIMLANIFLILLLCGVPNFQVAGVNETPASTVSVKSINIIDIPTQGIDIENDTAFTTYGFLGDGSVATPYLIENYTISTNNQSIGIQIKNTAKSFIIKNCTLTSVGGIYPYGISVSSVTSSVIRIENNTVINANATAIWIEQSNNAVIQNNTFNNNVAGIALIQANNTIVSHNTGRYNNQSAIFTLNSYNLVISSNTFDYNGGDNIGIGWGNNITINENIMTYSVHGSGLTFGATNNSYVINNTMGYNHVTGFFLDDNSTNNNIYENVFDDNVVTQASDDGSHNLFYNATTKKGNYYSDFVNSPGVTNYTIIGSANNFDPYPLYQNLSRIPLMPLITTSTSISTTTDITTVSSIATVTETKTTAVSIFGILLALPVFFYFKRRRR